MNEHNLPWRVIPIRTTEEDPLHLEYRFNRTYLIKNIEGDIVARDLTKSSAELIVQAVNI